jgi:hypothetical protein
MPLHLMKIITWPLAAAGLGTSWPGALPAPTLTSAARAPTARPCTATTRATRTTPRSTATSFGSNQPLATTPVCTAGRHGRTAPQAGAVQSPLTTSARCPSQCSPATHLLCRRPRHPRRRPLPRHPRRHHVRGPAAAGGLNPGLMHEMYCHTAYTAAAAAAAASPCSMLRAGLSLIACCACGTLLLCLWHSLDMLMAPS